MADALLARLRRRGAPPSPELTAALDQLDRLAAEAPELAGAATLQAALLRALGAPALVGALDIPGDLARTKLAGGTPLLRGEQVPLDATALRASALRLCAAMRAQGALEAAPIAEALRQRTLDLAELAHVVLAGDDAALEGRAGALGLDRGALGTLLRFSLFPSLRQLAEQLAPLRLVPWRHGYCPTCGSWPLLAEQRGLDQARYLRCGLCATAWPLDRMLCPVCATRDHNQLGALFVEGREQERAATCDACGCYLKVLATLVPIPPLELAVRDVATIHLDIVARERGYTSLA
jgi:FdhE protein